MDIRKAIRKAWQEKEKQPVINLDLPNGSKSDVLLIMSLAQEGVLVFINPAEQHFFEDLAKNDNWTLGGRLTASFQFGSKGVHAVEAVMGSIGGHRGKIVAIKIDQRPSR